MQSSLSRRAVVVLSVAVLGVGCASRTVVTPPVAPAPVTYKAADAAPVVNVFGDVDGIPRPTEHSGANSALRQQTFVAEGADADVSLDPSGTWMVFTSTRHSNHPKVYLQKVDGVTVTQLTTDDADDANPVFSPDGKRIAFSSNRSGHWSIYVMDVDGKNSVQVTNARTHDLHPSFSPDGTQLVYSSLGAKSAQWELWTVDLTTNARRVIGEGLFPVWCPSKDVNRIAFQRPRQRGTHQFSIWTIDLHDGEPRNLTEVAVATNAALVTPAWSPDGKQIAFASLADIEGVRQHDLWVVDAEGTNRRRVTDGTAVTLSPVFSPADSRLFFISDRGGLEAVWSVAPWSEKSAVVETHEGKPEHKAAASVSGEHASVDTKETP